MTPRTGRHGGGRINLLFATVAFGRNGEAHLAAAGHWREEKIIGRVRAKIEDALPDRAAVPFHPGCDRAAIGHGIGQQNVIGMTVEVQHIASSQFVGDKGAVFQRAIVTT